MFKLKATGSYVLPGYPGSKIPLSPCARLLIRIINFLFGTITNFKIRITGSGQLKNRVSEVLKLATEKQPGNPVVTFRIFH